MLLDKSVISKEALEKITKLSPLAKIDLETHPLKIHFQSSAGTLTKRECLSVAFTKEKQEGFGEASPLPGYSRESIQEVRNEIKDLIDQKTGQFDFSKIETLQFPSSRFAVSAAIYDLLAKLENRSIASFFSKAPIQYIPVNALNPCNKTGSLEQSHECVKIKISPVNWREVFEGLNRFPENCLIRLDANQLFSREEAVSIFKQFGKFNIEYIEEPFRPTNPEELERFQQETALPLALDETLYHSPPDIKKWIISRGVSTLVLKPTFLGSINFCRSIIENAEDKKIVISSAFEHYKGFRALVQLASSVGAQLSHCGLDTLKYFEPIKDFDLLKIEDGRIRCQ